MRLQAIPHLKSVVVRFLGCS